jgi:hypothetical protein
MNNHQNPINIGFGKLADIIFFRIIITFCKLLYLDCIILQSQKIRTQAKLKTISTTWKLYGLLLKPNLMQKAILSYCLIWYIIFLKVNN